MNEEKKISFFYNAITGETVRLENSDYINKDKIKRKIEELKEQEQELTDEQGYWGSTSLLEKIDLLEELLEGD